jgi:hypothetical protein
VKRRDEAQNALSSQHGSAASGDEVWQPRGSSFGARALASLVPRITQKSFEKHGFAAASLITDWAQIVGLELARDTRPLKLKWPRGVQTFAEVEAGETARPGATLLVQVDPAVALDIQYRSAQLIDRINAYFGYRAVATLRIVQEPIAGAAGASNPAGITADPAQIGPENQPESAVGNEDPLASALSRLGAHVRAQSQRRKG